MLRSLIVVYRVDDVPPNASGPDGMHVFRSWGAEIRKFALTFDHDKGTLVISLLMIMAD